MKQKIKFMIILSSIVIFTTLLSKNAISDLPKRILLIVMDGARYDYCTPETMPNLFSFMEKALVFKKAYSPSSWTLPSHASLFTGLYPQQHGAFMFPYQPTTNVSTDTKRRFEKAINIDNISIPHEAITIADILRTAGYQTLGVFANPCYGYPIFNLHKGFDTWVNIVENKFKITGEKHRGFYSTDYEVGGKYYTVIPNASEVAAEVTTVLNNAHQEKPIFLFINFDDPIATPYYFPPHKRKKVYRKYKLYLKKSMRRVDDVLLPILSFFRDGLIIITSDHGQGDGTIFKPNEHSNSLHPFQTKIPLFIHNLKSKNLDINKPIGLTLIMDIILEATGLNYPGRKMFLHPHIPAAFSHIDSRPGRRIGNEASFSIYTNQGLLILTRNSEGFTKKFYQEKDSEINFSDQLQIENNLSEMIFQFTELERVFPKTGIYRKPDEKNIEMLKSLGYIE